METSLEPEESVYFNRHEYRFALKDDKGLFRSNKTLMCKYIILAESKEKADECLKREIDIAFKATIEDLSNYSYILSDVVYSSDSWKPGLLYYDQRPVKSVNEL